MIGQFLDKEFGSSIPIFYNQKTNEVIYETEIMDKVISLVEKEGTDIWFKYEAKEIIESFFKIY